VLRNLAALFRFPLLRDRVVEQAGGRIILRRGGASLAPALPWLMTRDVLTTALLRLTWGQDQ
jgi:hypothetical protein